MISGDANNNKYYNMIDEGNGSTFRVEYGRVEVSKSEETYPLSRWDSIYKAKTKKGYKDVTHLLTEKTIVADTTTKKTVKEEIKDPIANELITLLRSYANQSIAVNYTVSVKQVTQAQVNEAQRVLDEISAAFKAGKDVKELDRMILELFAIIPRKMAQVKNHLFSAYSTKELREQLIQSEQDTLDTLAGQVMTQAKVTTADVSVKDDAVDLMSALGLDVKAISKEEIEAIRKKLTGSASLFIRSWKVNNKKTKLKFDKFVADADNKKVMELFHGSGNSNWWNIFQTGLILRPQGVVIAGKMFGYGTYFADDADKSLGYTDSGRWRNGSSANVVYMAIYEVHVGKQYEVTSSDSSLNDKILKSKGNYDSTFAKAGYSLRKNEFIVYNENQSTIKYLIELKG